MQHVFCLSIISLYGFWDVISYIFIYFHIKLYITFYKNQHFFMELMWILELISLFDRTLNPLLLLLWYLILCLKLGFLFKLNPRDLDFAYLITMLNLMCC